MTTIDNNTSPLTAAWFAIAGGKFRVRLEDPHAKLGQRYGQVLDAANNVIGDASDYIYGGAGFAVHTAPYAGYVTLDQIDFVL